MAWSLVTILQLRAADLRDSVSWLGGPSWAHEINIHRSPEVAPESAMTRGTSWDRLGAAWNWGRLGMVLAAAHRFMSPTAWMLDPPVLLRGSKTPWKIAILRDVLSCAGALAAPSWIDTAEPLKTLLGWWIWEWHWLLLRSCIIYLYLHL